MIFCFLCILTLNFVISLGFFARTAQAQPAQEIVRTQATTFVRISAFIHYLGGFGFSTHRITHLLLYVLAANANILM